METQSNPVFDTKAMIEVFKNFGIVINIKDLKQITFETVTMVYDNLIENCLFVKINSPDLEPQDAVLHFSEDVVKNQFESFKLIQRYIVINYLFHLTGNNYGLVEIFSPSKKLFLKQMSVLINFARFVFHALGEFGEIQAANNIYFEQCEQLKQEISVLQQKNFILKTQKTEKRPLIENARKRIAALNEKLIQHQEKKKALLEKIAKAKKEENELTTLEVDLNSRLGAIQKKMNLYEKLIIKSPQRLKTDMEKMETRAIELNKLSKIMKDETVLLDRDLFERERYIEGLKGVHETLKNFYQNDILKGNLKMGEIEKAREEITNLNLNITEIESNICAKKHDKGKLEVATQKKAKETEQHLFKLKEKEDALSDQIKENMSILNSLEETNQKYQEEKAKYVKDSQDIMSYAFGKFAKIQKELEKVVIEKKAEEDFMGKLLKENSNVVENLNKMHQQINDFIDKSYNEFMETGTFNLENAFSSI